MAGRNDSLDLSSDSGTRSSMEIFRRPRITSLQTESVGTLEAWWFGAEICAEMSISLE